MVGWGICLLRGRSLTKIEAYQCRQELRVSRKRPAGKGYLGAPGLGLGSRNREVPVLQHRNDEAKKSLEREREKEREGE